MDNSHAIAMKLGPTVFMSKIPAPILSPPDFVGNLGPMAIETAIEFMEATWHKRKDSVADY